MRTVGTVHGRPVAPAGRVMALALAAASLAACDTDQSVFFQDAIEDVPAVVDLGELVPMELPNDVLELGTIDWPADADGNGSVNQTDELINDELSRQMKELAVNRALGKLRVGTVYTEVGPTGSSAIGGATFRFVGTGGDVCIWMDPELVSWSQSVSPTDPDPDLAWPDNLFDDGDIDLDAGPSVFYTGTPGQRMGRFKSTFRDSLGIETTVDLSSCTSPGAAPGSAPDSAGRAAPEGCSIYGTIPDRPYTVVLETFSVPLDDKRLGMGMFIVEGSCDELDAALGGKSTSQYGRECVITGESIDPFSEPGAAAAAAGLSGRAWLGDERVPWDGSVEFELAFCHNNESSYSQRERTYAFCETESDDVALSDDSCSWFEAPQGYSGSSRRCFCGDTNATPRPGSF